MHPARSRIPSDLPCLACYLSLFRVRLNPRELYPGNMLFGLMLSRRESQRVLTPIEAYGDICLQATPQSCLFVGSDSIVQQTFNCQVNWSLFQVRITWLSHDIIS